MKKIQFPGLNGVRFVAALLVIVDHTELFKSYLGYPTFWAKKQDTRLESLLASGSSLLQHSSVGVRHSTFGKYPACGRQAGTKT
jgi:peptidoglycan/LPS O-acetylase OafA/YrhL